MVYKIILSSKANREVEEILLYLDEHWYAEIIDRFMKDLAAIIYRIEKYSFSFPKVYGYDLLRKAQLLLYYSIFFEIEGDNIRILSIFDQRQNPSKLKTILPSD